MRKQVIRVPQIAPAWDQGWLDLDKAALVFAGWTTFSGNRAPGVEVQLARGSPRDRGYAVDLVDVGVLELIIVPDKGGGETRASLIKMRIA
jgi:hypothetical protein